MEVYVGMDVHCKESVFVAEDGEGKVVCEGRVPTTAEGFRLLRTKYGLEPGTSVALETGTSAFFAVRHLARLEFEPVVVNAHEVRKQASRPNQKSDRRDAIELCEGLRRGSYRSIIHVPDANVQRLRQTLSRRRHFIRLMTRETNAVKHLLRSEGLGDLARSLKTEVAWDRLHKRLAFAPELQGLLSCHHEVWSCCRKQVEHLDGELEELAKFFPEAMRHLRTIPGVGTIVGLTLIAVLSDVERFPSAKHVASYAGLIPSTYQTGERNYQGRITKKGSGELRAMLCEAAHQAAKARSPLHPYFAKLCAKRGYKMAVVAIAHRLLRISWAMLRHGTEFQVERLGVEEGPFEVKSTRYYRFKETSAA